MPLSGAAWSSTLQASLASKGFTGNRLQDFTDAIGFGTVDYLIGKQFTTNDSGLVPGSGVGVGVGLTGFVVGNLSSLIFSKSVSYFGSQGNRLQDICDSLEETFISELANTQLDSTHSPVFSGIGNIIIGSLTVDGASLSISIDNEGSGNGFIGNQWPNFAKAIGEAQAEILLSEATGIVNISGSGGPPSGGSGTGIGVIS